MSNNLDNILRKILLSHVVIKDLPGNNTDKTLIKIHLIPASELPYKKYSSMYPKNIIKQKKNLHVSHLPKYHKITENTININGSNNNLLFEKCSICYNQFKMGEYFRKLPLCNHFYHKKCIDKWFMKDKKDMNCPICRTSHTKEKVEEFNTIQNQKN
jgi:hypothetical protein